MKDEAKTSKITIASVKPWTSSQGKDYILLFTPKGNCFSCRPDKWDGFSDNHDIQFGVTELAVTYFEHEVSGKIFRNVISVDTPEGWARNEISREKRLIRNGIRRRFDRIIDKAGQSTSDLWMS